MTNNTTIDTQEIAKFARWAEHWWNKDGVLKTLHDINPIRLAFINQYVDIAGKNVLDVGCGGGILSEAMAENRAFVTGIDAESEAITAAITHAKNRQLTINYQCMPIEEYESNSIDVITCMEMLEHVNDPQCVINHCARLLDANGFLFLSTINRSLKAYAFGIVAAEYLLGLLPRQTHDYQKFITPAELAAMARKAGLRVVGMRGIAYNPVNRSAKLCDSVAVNYLMVCTLA